MKRSLFKLFSLLLICSGMALAQQSTNAAQVAGTATSTGNGVTGAGVQRVTISSDSTGQVGLATGSNTIGALTANQSVNASQVNGVTTLTGNGVSGTGSMRVNIASDNTAFSVNATLTAQTTLVIGTVRNIGNAGGVFDTTAGATAAANSVQAGAVYNSGGITPSTGQQEPLQLDSTGHLLVNCTGCSAGSTVSLTPGTSGGLTTKHFVAAATDNATSAKGSAGQVYSIDIFNNAAYPVYFKLYNSASSPTGCAATNLFKVVGVQSGTQHILQSEQGWAMGTGIGYCLTKGIADTDDTAVLLSDASVDIGYK